MPVEFWRWLRPQLNAVKPVFLLAEGDDLYLHPAFDMTYSWNLPPVLWDICAGHKPAVDAGKGLQVAAMMVLMGSLPGKPLLYNG